MNEDTTRLPPARKRMRVLTRNGFRASASVLNPLLVGTKPERHFKKETSHFGCPLSLTILLRL
jgi:hypothetical protein